MHSLKTRFILLLIFILLSVIFVFFIDAKILQKIEKQQNDILHVKETHILLLQIRRTEKDFLSREDIKYYNKMLELFKRSQKNFLNLGLEKDLKVYQDTFSSISKYMITLGLKENEALKAKFNLHTSQLEKDLTEDKHINILIQFLLMRKHEKDFFLHREVKYLKLRENMIKKIQKNISLKVHTNILLKNYNLAFINLKAVMLKIGLNENLALHGKMRKAAHQIENNLQLINKNIPLIEANIQNLKLIRFIIVFALFSFISIMFFIIIHPVYKAFFYYRDFFSNYANASDRIDLNKLKFIELTNIAKVVNTMLLGREKFEDELIKSKDEAIHLQKVKEQFLTNMSHELRTPLNAIIGFSSLLNNKLPHESQLISPIQESSHHLLEIINDILDISKIQSGKFSIHKELFNFNEKLNPFLENFYYKLSEKHITFKVNSSIKNDLYLNGDWLRISQVINNFFSNALKFTPKYGTIELSLNYDATFLNFSIHDTGIGISQEVMQKILNPFEQADSSTTKNFGGTGLGLSISNSIVKMMDGKITIESQEKVGSTFSFQIKLEQASSTKIIPKVCVRDEEINIAAHVLIVEDNKTNQMLLSMLLDDAGMTFDIANDGLEAVKIYEDNKYNIVLMDENMPNMNGVDAMLKIREDHDNVVPIIAVTANVMKGDEKRLLDAGMDGFVAKPIDDKELYATIQSHLH